MCRPLIGYTEGRSLAGRKENSATFGDGLRIATEVYAHSAGNGIEHRIWAGIGRLLSRRDSNGKQAKSEWRINDATDTTSRK